jgi:HEAT repeat protein
LAELERRGLVDAPAQWAKLLRETRGSDQIAAVRAVAAHPSAPVTQELVALLASDDPLLVAAAAISLGAPGNDAAVEPLARLLGSNETRVRMAAVRGLGRISTPAAKAQLAEAASANADPSTRRRAAAEATRTP